jgi:hypothetical protein
MTKMKTAALVAATALTLAGCQTSQPVDMSNPAEVRAACERAKQSGDYDTPLGRAAAYGFCNPGGDPDGSGFWREKTRHEKCVRETGKVCAS